MDKIFIVLLIVRLEYWASQLLDGELRVFVDALSANGPALFCRAEAT
jgi:hypothetical protein